MQRTPEKTALRGVFYIPVRVWVLVWRSLANTREGARGGTWLLKLSVPRSIRQFNALNFRPVCPPACWTSSGCSRVISDPTCSKLKFVIFPPTPTPRSSVSSFQQMTKLSIHLLKPETKELLRTPSYLPHPISNFHVA